MFGLVVRFDLRPGAGDAFDQLVGDTLPAIQAEEGTMLYVTQRVTGADDARVFYEVYASEQAFDRHEAGPEVRRFLQERERFLAGPPRAEFLGALDGKGLPVPA